MATIKSYSDLQQSKKLAEILPLESDMYYFRQIDDDYFPPDVESIYPIPLYKDGKEDFNYDIPCWSLAALLGVLPQSITKYIESERCQKTFHLNLFRSHYYCVSYSFIPSISDDDNNTLYCVGMDNWVDACVVMIEKLNELKML